jgi:hypothetical protein
MIAQRVLSRIFGLNYPNKFCFFIRREFVLIQFILKKNAGVYTCVFPFNPISWTKESGYPRYGFIEGVPQAYQFPGIHFQPLKAASKT